jgi:hypothetical protein
MDEQLAALHRLIADKYGDSDLTPMSDTEIAEMQANNAAIPQHLLDFYRVIGTGRIGSSRYMIHDLLPPSDIYDPETSATLGAVVIVGDDFAGNCEAYDPGSTWSFGSIDSSGAFETMGDDHPTIVDWLLFLLGDA